MKRQRIDIASKAKSKRPQSCDLVYPFDHKKCLKRDKTEDNEIDPVYPFNNEPPAPLPPFVSGGGGISSNGLELKINTAQPAAVINDAVTVRYQSPLTTENSGALGVAVDGTTIVVNKDGKLAATGSGSGTGTGSSLTFHINTEPPATVKNNSITVNYKDPIELKDEALGVKIDDKTIKIDSEGKLYATAGGGSIDITAQNPINVSNGSISLKTGNGLNVNSSTGQLDVSVAAPLKIDNNSINLAVDTNQFTIDNNLLKLSNILGSRVSVLPPLKIQNGYVQLPLNDLQLFTSTDKLSLNKQLDIGTFIFRYGQGLPSFNNISSTPSYRINSLQITNKGTILAFSDYRASANDQVAIEPVLARSTDGGATWTYIKPVAREGSGVSRLMDPTTIYDRNTSRTWLLLGCWLQGSQNWTQPAETANKWSHAVLAWSDNDGQTWTSKKLPLSSINGSPSDCKGFLGGVGAGIVMSNRKLVFPIQWTTAKYDVYPSIIYSSDNGNTWTWASASPGKNTLTDLKFKSGENMVVEDVTGQLLMMSRYDVVGRRAIRTKDMGSTWQLDLKYDLKLKVGGACQGSFNLITTKSGIKLLLATAVTNVIGDRSGITLFLFSHNGNPIPIYCINLPVSGGYSTLAYINNDQGERLLVIYESQNPYDASTDSKSQKIKDLTFLIPRMENIVFQQQSYIYNMTNLDEGKYVFKKGVAIDNFYNISSDPFFRGNSIQITKKGVILVFGDYRAAAVGNCAIEPALARSDDGGCSWTYKKVANRINNKDSDPELSRLMDPTSLYDPNNNRVWLLLGCWIKGKCVWTAPGQASNTWLGAVMAWSDDDGITWNSNVFRLSQIQNSPQDCKGFLGGVGSGMVMSDGTIVFPIQWTKAQQDVYPAVIYSSDHGTTWKWGQGSPGKGLSLPSGENMVIQESSDLVMLCRNVGSNGRKAFKSSNMGNTWSEDSRFDLKFGGNCQGTFQKIKTKSGTEAVIATAVTNLISTRSGITLFVYPRTGQPVPLYCINANASGGYSCVAYSNSDIGEKLLVTYEFTTLNNTDGQSIKIKDLTFLIPAIEKIATSDL